MSWEIFFILALLAFAIVSFLIEKFPVDQIAITVFAALLVGGMMPFAKTLPWVVRPRAPDDPLAASDPGLLSVFANPAPLTIAAMFVLSAALERVGVIEILATSLAKLAKLGYRWFLLVLIFFVAVISAFINNTPVVMVFLPVVLTLSRSLGVPASKLLIPLSYASIFGGTCTLVGTSTNILASGILEKAGEKPISMFELAGVGLPLLFVGAAYLTFFGHRLLPERETLTSILSDEERKEFITEAFVQQGSPLNGKTVSESRLTKDRNVRLLEIIRDEVSMRVKPRETILEEGDRLVLACRPAGFAHARSIEGLDLRATKGLETVSAHEGSIVEGVIGPKSTIVGQSIRDINFRQRYRVLVMAIHRRGANLRDEIDTIPLAFGDLLLMMGTDTAIDKLRNSGDILLLDHPRTPSRSMRQKAWIVLATVAAVIAAASLNLAPIVAAAMIGAAIVFAAGVLETKDGYASIEWSIIFLIYGMLGLGLAMKTTGTADLVARSLTSLAGWGLPETLAPYVLLALIYLTTMLMTETLSNNATVVLMAPIAMSLGDILGIDSRPFVIATCIAASASFSTPIGYQTNTYVYGIGGYRFADFAKVGVPLNLLYFVASVFLIPWIWEF